MKTISSIIVGLVLLFGSVLLVKQYQTSRLTGLYPKIEELIAITSLTNWRDSRQGPPLITRQKLRGERSSFTLDCKDIAWETKWYEAGELFSCFKEVQGESDATSLALLATDDENLRFSWRTLFDNEVEVTINPDQEQFKNLYIWRDGIQQDEACVSALAERGNARSQCFLTTYVVKIDGLSASGSISFLVSEGYRSWPDPEHVEIVKDQWVVYLGGSREWISLGYINLFLAREIGQVGYSATPPQSRPKHERTWMRKDLYQIADLFYRIKNDPNYGGLVKFLDE